MKPCHSRSRFIQGDVADGSRRACAAERGAGPLLLPDDVTSERH
jgi:hypothetical protein